MADADTPAAATISEIPSQIIRARRKRTLETGVERDDVAEPHAGSRVLANRRRELGEGQGVPGGLPEDSVPQRRGDLRRESRHHVPCVAIAQRLQSQLVDTGGVERRFVAFAKPHHHCERIGAEAAGDEGEGIGGWAIEPLDIVGDDQDRGAGGRVREERERCEGDEERVLGRSLDEAKRHAEGRILRLRQRVEPCEDRSKQLVEASEGQVCLGPDAGRMEDPHPRGLGQHDGPLQKRRLADARIAVDQERPATGRRLDDEAGDDRQLAVPAEDPFAGDHGPVFPRQATSTTGLPLIATASSPRGTVESSGVPIRLAGRRIRDQRLAIRPAA